MDKNTERPIEGCELTLSADNKWLRLIVNGKLIATFHVNYANKILGNKNRNKSTTDLAELQQPETTL